jgi:two-component system, OmpR family, response regulator
MSARQLSTENAGSEGMARILLVEDDAAVREGVGYALRNAGYEVLSVTDGAMLSSYLEHFRPDLIVLDVYLPEGPDGFDLARQVRGSSPAPIIFLTAADGLQDRLRGFALGADDYIIKPFSLAELLARADAVLRRTGRLYSPTWQLRDLVVDEANVTVLRAGERVLLTRTEFEVLRILGRSPGVTHSRAQLLLEIWGLEAEKSNIVESTIHTLRRKLEKHGQRMIFTIRSEGYVLR